MNGASLRVEETINRDEFEIIPLLFEVDYRPLKENHAIINWMNSLPHLGPVPSVNMPMDYFVKTSFECQAKWLRLSTKHHLPFLWIIK